MRGSGFSKIFTIVLLLFLVTILPGISHAAQLQYELKQGWNMITFPFDQVTDISDNSHISNILFHYNTTTGGYDFSFVSNPSSINKAYAYWLQTDADTTITVTGDPVAGSYAVFEVKTGWNQLGYPYQGDQVWGQVGVTELPPPPPDKNGSLALVNNVNDAISEGWLSNILFSYNPNSCSYDFVLSTSNLPLQKGLWLQADHQCYLVFNANSGNVTGTVTEGAPEGDEAAKALNDPVSGVTVAIGGITTTTDGSGNYTLSNVPSGNRTITGTKSGYNTYSATISVVAESTVTHNFPVSPSIPPQFTSISPTTGGPRTIMLIQGSYFGSTPGTVSIGGVNAAVFTGNLPSPLPNAPGWTSNMISVLVPDGVPAGPQNVVVTKSSGLQGTAGTFTVYNQGVQGQLQYLSGTAVTDNVVIFIQNAEGSIYITNSLSRPDGTFQAYTPDTGTVPNLELDSKYRDSTPEFFIDGINCGSPITDGQWATNDDGPGNPIMSYTSGSIPPLPWFFSVHSITPSPSPTVTPSPSPTPTVSPTVTPSPSPTPTVSPSPTPTPQPGKGHIQGTVYDQGSSTLLAGVECSITDSYGTIIAATDASGQFTLINIEPGSYNLYLSKTGYLSLSRKVTVNADQTITTGNVYMSSGGTMDLCSIPRTTEISGRYAAQPTVSDNGDIIAFKSTQPHVEAHTGTSCHIYYYNRNTHTLHMTDLSPEGNEASLQGGACYSDQPFISGDGNFIAFTSDADNLLGSGNDANVMPDVFVCRRSDGLIARVSVDYLNPFLGGYTDNSYTSGALSNCPTLSYDGSYCAFSSDACNIVSPGYYHDTGNPHRTINIYRVRLSSGTGITVSSPLMISQRKVSGECDPAQWNGYSRCSTEPHMSSNGRFITYISNAQKNNDFTGTSDQALVSGTDGARSDYDIFLCDTNMTVTSWTSFVSMNQSSVVQSSGNLCLSPKVSDSGNYVVFQCIDSNSLWSANGDGFWDVWLKNMGDGSLIKVSHASSGNRGTSYHQCISRDGSYVGFATDGTGFVKDDTNNCFDCYIYNVAQGEYTRVSVTEGLGQASEGSCLPFISGNNNYIGFTSTAKNIISNPLFSQYYTTGVDDIYLFKWKN